MAAPGSSPVEMLGQLEQARKLALADAAVYNQIVPGILPIIGPAAPVEVRRWGADFLAEAFASPALPASQKETLTSDIMPLLRGMIESQSEDLAVQRSLIQAAASIYPLVFRRVISHPDQALLWQDMASIKLNILQRMDYAPAPVRICCIKFLQKVVQVQTPGLIADPRKQEHNETSIALVPRNHPLLPLPNLEAETSALLDRLLSVIQENSGDPLLVDATMNCLAVLVRTRPAISNKIISAILNYNPLKHATSPLTPRSMVLVKSLERTTRALLHFIIRAMPQHPLEQKMKSYLMRLQQSRTALFSEAHSQKRPAEPTDGLDDAKRQRLEAPRKFPPMPPPPHTFAHLFTLTEDPSLQQFDVKALPVDMVCMITSALMQHIDSQPLDQAVEEIRQRYYQLEKAVKLMEPLQGPVGIDDEDDYDPEALAGSNSPVLSATEKVIEELTQPILELGPFELPKPPPLTSEEIVRLSDLTVDKVFEIALAAERSQAQARQKSGLNRVAASNNDRDAWVTMMVRLATRAPAGLIDVLKARFDTDQTEDRIKLEGIERDESHSMVPNRIREILFNYILADWRRRLDLAMLWLTEEWYSDKIQASAIVGERAPAVKEDDDLPNYNLWSIRLLENLVPRFDATDHKFLVRFLSELPAINKDILERLKPLTRDPGTIKVCILGLQYLFMMRPPARQIVVDTMEAIWREGDAEVKASTGKLLNKWKPGFMEQAATPQKMEVEDTRTYPNGVKEEDIRSTTAVKSE